MDQRLEQQREECDAPALALRPGRITVYRALLAKQRQGPFSPRDAVALAGLREFLRSSGGIPADEGSPATPPAEEIEDRG
jgi:hypothetical protein